MLEIIYQELVLNSSTASHPDTVHEFAQCFLLLKDLWLICGILVLEGQGGNTPCSLLRCRFFTHTLIEESLIAADDRRHSASHLSQWVSIKDLIKKASARSTENTPIPSCEASIYPEKSLDTKCLKFYFTSSSATQNLTKAITWCTS